MLDTFGIPLAFVIIAALTLWVVIGSKGYWWFKMIMVSISIFFSISLWNSLSSLQGWPTADMPPEKFEVKWIDVKEPNKKTGAPGSIYVWVRDLQPDHIDESFYMRLHHKELEEEPRLYKLPYSRGMHVQSEMIKGTIAKGGRFFAGIEAKGQGQGQPGQGKPGKGKGKGQGQGKGKPGQGKDGRGGSLSQEQEFVFHELPPPVFPEKDPQPVLSH
jgi:hypothetical protein